MVDGPRDEHRLPIQELLQRLVTDIGTGLTNPQVQANLQLYGPNSIAVSLHVPEWLRFCKCLFGGNAVILWIAIILSFANFSIQAGLVSARSIYGNIFCGSFSYVFKPLWNPLLNHFLQFLSLSAFSFFNFLNHFLKF